MTPDIQDTLLQLFEQVRLDSDTIPPVPIDGWREHSAEWRLLTGFRSMLEQVQQRTLQLKQAEQQLREREEQYRSVFEATDEGLCIIDLDGFFVEANPAHCKLLGYTYEELIGLHYSETTYPEFYPVLDENIRTIQAGDRFQTRGLARRKDGSPLPVEAHSTPFTYKGKPHLLGVMRDISERVQVEERLREKEEQYRAIFEANTDSLTIARLEDGQIVEANPATCKMLGYSYEEVIGLSPVDVVSPDYLPVVAEGLQTIMAGGRSDVLMVALRKDGTPFPVEAHSTRFIYKGKLHLLAVSRDVSERIATEQQLREKEEQYRSIFEAGTDGLFIIDLEDSRAVEVNPMACQMFGYTREEMLGRPIGISDDTQQIQVHAREVVRAGGSFQMREITTRKDGTSFYADVHASPFTYKGKPHLLAIVRDISEQVQAEKQLREKEAQYRGVFEATSDGLIIRNMEGDVVEANPAVCKMHGYTYEEYRSLPRSALIHPDYLLRLAEIIQTVQAGRTFQGQAVDLRKDGSTFPVEFRSDPFMYLGQPHVLTVLRDITERVQAEQQLREKEAQYRGVFEATTDALVILDPDGFYVEANPAMCRMFGYTHEELIGLHTSALTAPVSFPVLEESLKKIKVGRRFQAEGQALRKDGTVFYAEASLTPFTYQGKPHLLAATRDISEQVQAQQLLEQRVEERTRELSSLLDISHMVASTLQLKPLLGLILDQLKTVVEYTGAAILTVEGEDLIILDNRSPVPEEQVMQLRFPLKHLGLIWETVMSRESIIMQDVRDDSPLSQAFRVASGEIGETTFYYVRACLIIPLTLREQVIGMLVLTASEEDAFTQHHAALALAIAN
jgi:PAS domain S-box-containing protein